MTGHDSLKVGAVAFAVRAGHTDEDAGRFLDRLCETGNLGQTYRYGRLLVELMREFDTLAEWLYWRFATGPDIPAWRDASWRDREFWEHEAEAVKRAAARDGFKRKEGER